jgi:hypothetical protein
MPIHQPPTPTQLPLPPFISPSPPPFPLISSLALMPLETSYHTHLPSQWITNPASLSLSLALLLILSTLTWCMLFHRSTFHSLLAPTIYNHLSSYLVLPYSFIALSLSPPNTS